MSPEVCCIISFYVFISLQKHSKFVLTLLTRTAVPGHQLCMQYYYVQISNGSGKSLLMVLHHLCLLYSVRSFKMKLISSHLPYCMTKESSNYNLVLLYTYPQMELCGERKKKEAFPFLISLTEANRRHKRFPPSQKLLLAQKEQGKDKNEIPDAVLYFCLAV